MSEHSLLSVWVTPSFLKAETPLESCLECLSREELFVAGFWGGAGIAGV